MVYFIGDKVLARGGWRISPKEIHFKDLPGKGPWPATVIDFMEHCAQSDPCKWPSPASDHFGYVIEFENGWRCSTTHYAIEQCMGGK